MTDNADLPEIMTPTQVAALLGVHAKTVSNWAKQGRLSSTRTMGGHRRFRRADVVAALERLEMPATQ